LLQAAPSFSLIFDGTTGVSHFGVEALLIRIGHRTKPPEELLLGVFEGKKNKETNKNDAKSLITSFVDLLSGYKLSVLRLVGIAADGASINHGDKAGVSTTVRNWILKLRGIFAGKGQPVMTRAPFFSNHCVAHVMQLATEAALSAVEASLSPNSLICYIAAKGIIDTVGGWGRKTPKFIGVCIEMSRTLGPQSQGYLAQKCQSGTRWLASTTRQHKVQINNWLVNLCVFYPEKDGLSINAEPRHFVNCLVVSEGVRGRVERFSFMNLGSARNVPIFKVRFEDGAVEEWTKFQIFDSLFYDGAEVVPIHAPVLPLANEAPLTPDELQNISTQRFASLSSASYMMTLVTEAAVLGVMSTLSVHLQSETLLIVEIAPLILQAIHKLFIIRDCQMFKDDTEMAALKSTFLATFQKSHERVFRHGQRRGMPFDNPDLEEEEKEFDIDPDSINAMEKNFFGCVLPSAEGQQGAGIDIDAGVSEEKGSDGEQEPDVDGDDDAEDDDDEDPFADLDELDHDGLDEGQKEILLIMPTLLWFAVNVDLDEGSLQGKTFAKESFTNALNGAHDLKQALTTACIAVLLLKYLHCFDEGGVCYTEVKTLDASVMDVFKPGHLKNFQQVKNASGVAAADKSFRDATATAFDDPSGANLAMKTLMQQAADNAQKVADLLLVIAVVHNVRKASRSWKGGNMYEHPTPLIMNCLTLVWPSFFPGHLVEGFGEAEIGLLAAEFAPLLASPSQQDMSNAASRSDSSYVLGIQRQYRTFITGWKVHRAAIGIDMRHRNPQRHYDDPAFRKEVDTMMRNYIHDHKDLDGLGAIFQLLDSVSPGSSSGERVFSGLGRVHSLLRYSLTMKHVAMLLFVDSRLPDDVHEFKDVVEEIAIIFYDLQDRKLGKYHERNSAAWLAQKERGKKRKKNDDTYNAKRKVAKEEQRRKDKAKRLAEEVANQPEVLQGYEVSDIRGFFPPRQHQQQTTN